MPVLHLGLSVGCGFEIRREYTLLLPQVSGEPPVVLPASARSETAPAVERSFPRHRVTPQVSPSLPLAAEMPAFPDRQQREVKVVKEGKPLPRVLRDRLVLTAPGEVGESALRLSPDLLSWRGEDTAKETQRELLRLEFRMLQALHEQALAQLETAERLRQMEGTLGELQQRTGEFNRRLEQRVETVAVSAVATPQLAPVADAKPVAKEKAASRFAEWTFYTALAAVALLIGALFAWRNRRQPARRVAEKNRAITPDPYIDPRRNSELEDFDGVDLPFRSPVTKPVDRSLAAVPVLTKTVPAAPAPVPSASTATVDEHFEVNPVLELADIMLSFGRVKGAAQALQEFVDQNPEEALQPWIRLMDVYRLAGMRSEFERVAAELNQHFNVEIQRWDSSCAADNHPETVHAPAEPLPIEWETTARQNRSIEDLEHIAERVVSLWPSAECLDYLNQLLRNNRGGQRSGFSLPIVDEMMFLVELLETLAKMESEAAGK